MQYLICRVEVESFFIRQLKSIHACVHLRTYIQRQLNVASPTEVPQLLVLYKVTGVVDSCQSACSRYSVL